MTEMLKGASEYAIMEELTPSAFDRATQPSGILSLAPSARDGVSNQHDQPRGLGMQRKTTGKRLRFEVFKRDGFACRYCGAQPPDVTLVVDHIVPVAAGGQTTIDNLNTACETCNQGKAAKPLDAVAPRPDADLMYLEVMQETAELRRYQLSLQAREVALEGLVCDLQLLWQDCYGETSDWVPSVRVLRQMLRKYDPEIVEEGIRDVAPKVAEDYIRGSYVPYMWRVLANLAEDVSA